MQSFSLLSNHCSQLGGQFFTSSTHNLTLHFYPPHSAPLWHHQKLFAVLVIVICFHFSKNKSYCCPVSWLGLLSLSSLWKSCPRKFTEIAEISTKKLSGWLTAARLIVPVARFSPVRSNLLISTPALSNFHPSGNWAWLPLMTWRKVPIGARG